MIVTPELVEEIKALTYFNLSNSQSGIKVHKSADPEIIEAFQRLYDKGLVTQFDGGYLTQLGVEAAEHVQNMLTILVSEVAA